MNKVILLCGKVGSGKTYTADRLHKENNAVILSCDELMLTMFDECLGEKKHAETQHRAFLFLAQTAVGVVEAGRDAVLDFGFWTKDSRDFAKEYFNSRNVPAEIYYIRSDDETRKARVKKRNEELSKITDRRQYIISEEMLVRFDGKFEEPDDADVIIEN